MITGYIVFYANNAGYGGGIGAAYSNIILREAASKIESLTDSQGTSGVQLDNSTSGQVNSNHTNHSGRVNDSGDPSLFSDVLFKNNKGSTGGAFFTLYSTINSVNTYITFVHNFGQDGGAVHSRNSQLRFGTSSYIASQQRSISYALIIFANNSAHYHGGAVNAYNSIVVFNDNSIFEQNCADIGRGGGIYAHGDTQVYFRGHTTFQNNVAGSFFAEHGGGIYSHESKFVFQNHTSFIGNVADNGAGIHARQSYLHFSGEILFFMNKARSSGCGGGIYLDSYSHLIFTGTGTFIKNSAAYSGGVFSISDSSTIDVVNGDITMAMNSAGYDGGAISLEGDQHFIDGRIDFLGNWAERNGGAVYATNCYLYIEGLYRFEDNAARNNGYGGAIHAKGTDIQLNGTYSFTNNSAKYGGGIAMTSYLNYFFYLEPYTSVYFRDNHAD